MIDLWAEKNVIQPYEAGFVLVDEEWLEKLRVEHDLLKEHSGRWLHFVAVDYPEIKESLSPQKLMELKGKAERWDQYAIYDNDKEPEILVKDLITAYEKLEAVKEIVYHKSLHPLSAILKIKGLLEAGDHS